MSQPNQVTGICKSCSREAWLNDLGYCLPCWHRMAEDVRAVHVQESPSARAARKYILDELRLLVGDLDEFPALAEAAVRDRRVVEEVERFANHAQAQVVSHCEEHLRRQVDDEDEE